MFQIFRSNLANYGLIQPTTLVLDSKNVAHNLIAPDKTLGIRIVKEPLFQIIGE
jgi:tRNA A37 threonylcarbamoyladenosine synthetase subunit TsaC/SUA5/YrdC